MTGPLQLDPTVSVPALYGSELRRFRMEANLTQEALGEKIFCTGSLVGLIETAKRTPSKDFTDRCDAVLDTSGALGKLWPLLGRGNLPTWFKSFVEHEANANSIFMLDVQTVPGLFQTEAYATAVLTAGRHQNVAELVKGRMDRQLILNNPTPPVLWAVIDEAVLRRQMGGAEVMHEQLQKLVELGSSPRIVLQVLPYSAGAHAGLAGAFTILTFDEGHLVVYVEGPGSGYLISAPDEIEQCNFNYDLVRAAALSPEASLDLIVATMEEL